MHAEYEERKMFVNSYDHGEMRSTLHWSNNSTTDDVNTYLFRRCFSINRFHVSDRGGL